MNIEKIKKIMEKKNITLYRLSKITDLNESNLGKIISGKTKDPRISYVKAIADALEVSIDEIVIRHN
ncbi:helix-turn-helix domain-containing protein [Thomasclavelia ramosa]|uniref:helix-turn-helix domain-containing protein n=1 Tax=Thomasclavelia ramosa TaxID=1547 RepID=UPI000E404E6E|nr:helix-turn-helix transcriptional regulator [Thomasclavelia ramosa]RGC87296.1 XRE family transcriptional regulator [Thomasclavelia ramosa]